MTQPIIIKSAMTNNLKGVDIIIPKKQINAFVGVSGSGKTSLVFDTIAAEAQRQMNETYPSFVRNRLPHYGKPEVTSIKNLSPVVIVNQKSLGDNQRSTVGTAADINPALRLLFSRFGKPFVGYSDHFSFNSSTGMCKNCEGLGIVKTFDLSELLDDDKSLNQGAIKFATFEPGSYRWKRYVDSKLFDNDKPLSQFTSVERELLLYSEPLKPPHPNENWYESSIYEGLIPRLTRTFIKNPSKGYRKYQPEVNRICSSDPCPICHGYRLKQETLNCLINGLHIGKCSELELSELLTFLEKITNPEATPLLEQLTRQLTYLCQVGLNYLSLDRHTGSLSGGESQRVKLVRYIGSSLSDLLYILDEPSIGLHPYDMVAIRHLITAIKNKGNTILLIDHDADIIQLADTIFELGPKAGRYGGQLINSLTYGEWAQNQLRSEPIFRFKCSASFTNGFTIHELSKHNLKKVSTIIPNHCLVAVTGVAGSGKSSFAQGVAQSYPELVLYINQKGIHGNRRSTIASYAGLFDGIRQLFARANQVSSSLFTFNGQGACHNCKGKGFVEMDLAFLEPVKSTCEVCDGKKYAAGVLSYRYHDLAIGEVLSLSIDEALYFFSDQRKIYTILNWLEKIGLGYLTLGQTLDTLSGGELQRLKLALHFNHRDKLFILDEPTTGLSQKDLIALVKIFDELLANNNTIMVIEHNMSLVIQADWLIDFGPGSGKEGGTIVYEGLPEGAQYVPSSITGRYLK